LKKKTDKMLTHKAYTFASRTSPDTTQSLQKSMLFPTLKKNKKFPPLKKNKTLPTHYPTDRKRMIEIVEKQNGMSLEKKEGQLVTCGIFYCRASGYFSVSASNKLSCNLTGQCSEIGNKPYRRPFCNHIQSITPITAISDYSRLRAGSSHRAWRK